MYPADNILISSPLMWIFMILTAVFCFLEYKLSKKWIFIIACVAVQVAATVTLLSIGGALADFLLYVLIILFIRLCFVMLERRKNG
jgi:hypothetical protein